MENKMDEQYHEDLSPSILGSSPLNTPYDQPGCSKELDSDKETDEYYIPSYQPPKEDAKSNSGHKKTPKSSNKRKATQAPPSTFHRSKDYEDGNLNQEIK